MAAGSDITIAVATPADARGLAAVRKAGWLTTYPNAKAGITTADILLKDFDSPDRIRLWESRMAKPGDVRTWVARTAAGRVVGFVGARRQEPAEIVALYVDPEFQGRGTGRRLMETALDWVGTEPRVSLHVVTYNYRAIRFYETFGFRPMGPTSSQSGVLPNGKVLPEIEMVRVPNVN